MIPASAQVPGAVRDLPLDARYGGVEPDLAPIESGPAAGRRTPVLSAASRAGLVLVVLPLGIVLGPHGLDVVSDVVVRSLTPALPVALAVIGALAGIRFDVRRPEAARSLLGWTLEGGFTMAVVAGGVFASWRLAGHSGIGPWPLAVLVALCASVSSPMGSAPAGRSSSPAVRLPQVDNVIAIALAGLALAWMGEDSLIAALLTTGQTALVAAAVAIAVAVLVVESSSDSEQRVFAVGAFLMLGGVAEYLSLSALFAGLVAGFVWRVVGGAAYERLARDTATVQHPLTVILLIVAGARLQPGAEIAGLVAAYLICRTGGKLIGGSIAARLSGPGARADSGLRLIPPGVIGVGIAANTLLTRGGTDAANMLLAVVVLGTVASSLLAGVFPARETT